MTDRITIIGCGLSGMITALFYASRGINTVIIETKALEEESFLNDVRTTALTSYSQKLLAQFNIWSELVGAAGEIKEIYVADNKAAAILHFVHPKSANEPVGYLIENSKLKTHLFKLVKNNSYITIFDNTGYKIISNDSSGCKLILNEETSWHCDLLVICDQKSVIRHSFFSSGYQKSYFQQAVTFIINHTKAHNNIAIEHFMPSGPFAVLPLQDSYHSSIVWTVRVNTAKVITALSRQEMTYFIQENSGEFLGQIGIVSKIAAFPLRAYLAADYVNQSIVLVADSAHIIHPLAGQGLNQGIKDIESLVKTTTSLSYDLPAALNAYSKARRLDNINMLLLTDTLNKLFSNDSKWLHFARQSGFAAVNSCPLIQKKLIEYGMGYREVWATDAELYY